VKGGCGVQRAAARTEKTAVAGPSRVADDSESEQPGGGGMMRRRLVLGLLLLLAGCIEASGAPRQDGSELLSERLESVMRSRAFRGARVSALVVRERDGAVLFEQLPDRGLIPASNTKVLTAVAALATFGPAYRFETTLWSSAPVDAEGGVDALYLEGAGDPAMNSEDWWLLAEELRRSGVRHVRGDLVLDDSRLDRVRWHPSLGRTSSRAYHGPVGALTANYAAFSVIVTPGVRDGDPVGVEISPPVSYLALSNRAVTGSRKARRSLVVDRSTASRGEIVNVVGTVRAGDPPKVYYRSVLDPTRYAGAVLRMQLAAVGITVEGEIRVARRPAEAFELLRFSGRPMAEIVRLFMKYSNNAIAETLVKAMGAQVGPGPGSWSTGVPAMRRTLLELGLDPGSFSLVDGSGLSYENRVTPRALVRALRIGSASFRFGPELEAALPIAARDGTLEKRAEGAVDVVRGKTGLLNRVTALSGFAVIPAGARLAQGEGNVEPERAVFSILVNGYQVNDGLAMDTVDRFVAELTRAPAPTAPRTDELSSSAVEGSR
jgi:D-alanyl-D-alanine carboxypeptidase/D-alanyl-D-alanine-endopeptidase (penicillin-binding protein 4)